MVGISTGTRLLSRSSKLKNLIVWHDFEAGSTYPNFVNPTQYITNTAGYQESTTPVSAGLGSYHYDNKNYSGSTSYNYHPYSTPYPQILTDDFSITYWVNTPQFFGGAIGTIIILLSDPSGSQFAVVMNGNRINIYIGGFLRATYDVTRNVWNNVTVTMTLNGAGSYVCNLYVNNVFVDTDIYPIAYNGLEVRNFMSYSAGTTEPRDPRHRIDSLGIYQSALTTSQIAYLYNSGAGRTYQDTIK